ncbi:MAG TPA: glycine zipper 2TM domain-containing protein [Phenylobacterium sp.]|nr:glycine zipper 2TM domain-containing protein [Phenylobacterium sp.]
MRKRLLAAGIAAAVLIPSLAMAQETCEERSANRTTGTVLGAIGGALLGNAVASHGGKTGGTIIGGVAGAAIGSNLAKDPHDCVHAYGYYDNDGRWHDNHVDRTAAYGYYDREGSWIDGPPPVSGYAADSAYTSRVNTMDVDGRINQIQDRIDRGRHDGSLSRRDANDAQRTLSDIRREESDRRGDGRLSDHDRMALQERLDRLAAQVHIDRQ